VRGTFERYTPAAPTSAELQEYAGTYYSDELDAPFVGSVRERGLVVTLASGDETPFTPTVRDAFASATQLAVMFVRDANRRVSGFTVNAGRVRGIAARRRAAAAAR